MRIGELSRTAGVSTKTIRYYESLGLLRKPSRTASGYRIYGRKDADRLRFVAKAKCLGFSLADVQDILTLHERNQYPCIHVLALLDRKISEIDALLEQMADFRRELGQLRAESEEHLKDAPRDGSVCGIIERGIHTRGELALVWIEKRAKAEEKRK